MKKEYADRCLMTRKGTNSQKWDGLKGKFGSDNLLPVWVADMDFKVPECVQKALHEYIETGAFGYYRIPDEYENNFIQWEEKHHGYKVSKDWLCFSPGIVCGIHWLVEALTEKNDCVILLSPVYYPFMDAINETGRKAIYSMLKNDKGVYTIDFDDFEEKIKDNNVKMFIMSSPHNPVGRIWTKDELQKILSICKKHNVYVLSDEIHHDFEICGKHIPTATVGDFDDIVITLTAPSKTFNLAACQNSFIIIPNERNRQKYKEYIDLLRIKNGNAFGYVAAAAAYKEGESWLCAILEEIKGNFDYMKISLLEKFPLLEISPLEGTYLAWIDFGAYVKHDEIEDFAQNKCGFAPDYGDWFFPDNMRNDTHLRINLATPRENIEKLVSSIERELSYLK